MAFYDVRTALRAHQAFLSSSPLAMNMNGGRSPSSQTLVGSNCERIASRFVSVGELHRVSCFTYSVFYHLSFSLEDNFD